MPQDQHTLINYREYPKLLRNLSLKGARVLELGVGTGILTQMILDQDPKEILGVEIEEGLCSLTDPSLKMVYKDLTLLDYDFLRAGDYWLIANPPYFLLPYIKENIIDKYPLKGVVLMVPETKKDLFPDFVERITFDPTDFDPPTKPIKHLVMVGGRAA